ncbi:MAG: prolipoprotein diacylglyceryl transferase [Rikenellaceae bacterium]|nr:prolipoprotein diacylglyceryl transferase [Rikenellaceae bacterium]MDE7355696.1 prolipoprotein diacylglyceryl transferase [Rikenellaceae bacterium]
MLQYIDWNFDPTLFSIGGFQLRYYSLTWMAAFVAGYYLFGYILKREGRDIKLLDNILVYAFLGTLIGSRLGHCIFYEDAAFWRNPLQVLYIWQGGLASHGAAVGMFVGLWLFSRKYRQPFVWVLDRVILTVPLGGAMIRLGNLFNSEVYGHPTDLPFAFRFIENLPAWSAGAQPVYSLPSHPTQIYEAVIYTLIFVVLMLIYMRTQTTRRYPGALFGIFLMLLFVSRFMVEHLKLVQDSVDARFMAEWGINIGQALSVPFIVAGAIITVMAFRGRFANHTITDAHGHARHK